ncbi:phosphotransferase [Paenibacillus sedimenti]|uniref:Phosphotransferase n=1 Tax=Paenibacillus sedimenti TaxID=2770274 RepID=A0A926QI62_9BACL|nr:phosphotransferase [Paenibacillus sedimenti]MBD0380261.1 phosphotransferase [Paenibacillus sedimenti]
MMQVKDQEELITCLPERWFPNQTWTLRTGEGGMNNTTRFVEVNGISYVLRVYETHRDLDKIHYEHAVLRALSAQKLPYRLPVPIQLPSGKTVVEVDSGQGKLAALFTFTDGCNPTWEHPWQMLPFGEAVGRLSQVLVTIQVGLKPVYPPYYEIEHIHPRCTPEAIDAFCMAPPEPFRALQSTLLYIRERFAAFYNEIPQLKKLPHQLVHGDINGSNMLIDEDGRIAAVLDFEFVTEDVRVMELAVCLSDLIDPALPEEELERRCSAFYKGYRAFIDLHEEELRLLPMLIELRRLDVFVHFLGRYLDGVDAQSVLVDIIHSTAEKVQWLQEHGSKLLLSLKR